MNCAFEALNGEKRSAERVRDSQEKGKEVIGVAFKNPYVLAALAAAQLFLLTGVYLKGRADVAVKCERARAEAALRAIDEKREDDESQADAGAASDAHLRDEIFRLRRRLETNNVATGLDCDAPGSGDSVRDAWGGLFEAGLPAGLGGDEPGVGARAPAMETGRDAER